MDLVTKDTSLYDHHMNCLLKLEKFNLHRNGISLFEPLSFTLKVGSALEIMGQNGVGKTSLLESLVGLHGEKDGDLFISPFNFYLSVKAPFDDTKTVYENLLFWTQFWGKPINILQSAIHIWSLTHLQDLPYKHLSQGQKQRVNLARLSLKQAIIWLLDEPTAFLDSKNIDTFKEVLKKHLLSGGAALIATNHSLNLDRKLLLKAFQYNPKISERKIT